jgi:hypothetical protein
MKKSNYCFINKNKIYGEIYDELLDEELSMFNIEHNDKIKRYLEKKILNNNYITIFELFESNDEIISDLIIKITESASNINLQGNTVLVFADSENMYELFHMEDLRNKYSDEYLNELSSISNIHLLPIYWGCGIFKSSYSSGVIKPELITIEDLANIFIKNYYHKGVLINNDNKLLEIEFTGEDPLKVIGINFKQSNIINIMGFNFMPFIESGNELNIIATKILGKEVKGRMFIYLLCPTTNKKIWDIDIKTINNIINIIENDKLYAINQNYIEQHDNDKDINPFYFIKKTLKNN